MVRLHQLPPHSRFFPESSPLSIKRRRGERAGSRNEEADEAPSAPALHPVSHPDAPFRPLPDGRMDRGTRSGRRARARARPWSCRLPQALPPLCLTSGSRGVLRWIRRLPPRSSADPGYCHRLFARAGAVSTDSGEGPSCSLFAYASRIRPRVSVSPFRVCTLGDSRCEDGAEAEA